MVAFVTLAPAGEGNFPGFTTLVLDNCAHVLESPERFAQTGVGWVLREFSRAEPDRLAGFIDAKVGRLSREALKNAIKRLPPETANCLQQAQLERSGAARRPRHG